MPINFSDIIKQIEAAQTEANRANQERYQQILSTLGGLEQQVSGRYTAAAGELSKLGQAGRTRIGTQATKAVAATEQDLITRGLGTSTIRMTAQRGIMSDAERARQELGEGLAAQRAGLLERRAGTEMQLGAMRAGVMERRADIGPDLSMFASLLQAAAASEKAATTAQRTSRIMGPMAQAGRTVFGQPFKYGGGGGGGLGAQGGMGGGGAAPTGGRLAGTVTGAARGPDAVSVPEGGPGGVGFFGTRGAVSTAPAGEMPWAPGVTVPPTAAAPSMVPEPEAGILEAAREMAGPEVAGKIGYAPDATGGGPFKTYEEYTAYQRSRGLSVINRTAWKYSAMNAARSGG